MTIPGKLFFRILIVVMLLPLAGCEEKKTYKIGVSQCSQDDWREKMNEEINREMMFHEDATVEIRSADDDSQRQIQDIRYFADNGFDIIIVSPNEANALTPVIEEMFIRGIPVVIFDRNINSSVYTARIGVDDVGLGRSAAHYALSLLGEHPKAIEIYGLRGSTPAEGRHKGFTDEFIAGGGEILASVPANWNKEDAMPATDTLLSKFEDVDLIFAHNDRMAIGASEIAKKHGRDNIRIIGIDAAPNIGIKAVADSVIDATFLYPTEGHRLIRTALAILKGDHFARETILPVSSAVDKSNADILLLQNETLKEETGKMKILKDRIDDYWEEHSSQTYLFYASIAIIILLFGVVFLILRSFWQHKRHQTSLMEQNRMLEEERDKQKILIEQQKTLNEKLQEATHSKLVFYTNVSHDLRTPLTLISEPVSQLAQADNLTEQQSTLVKLADKNIKILRRLINQILDFRKYENNKLETILTETDFGKAVEEWMDSFKAIARKRHMKLTLRQPKDGKPILMAIDQEKIERVFFNLLSNAFKYTPDNGFIDVSYYVKDNNLVFNVADTGKGISERDLGNIFNRFYQVDRVHPNGSGIGLSVSKAFVELHGGTISVESTRYKGSVFTVTLPIQHVAEEASELQKTISGEDVETELDPGDSTVEFEGGKPLVLVIDDNPDIRRLIKELLSDKYNVVKVSNGKDGLRKAIKYVPDLIICDLMMPEMDGLECCRLLKEEVTTSHIPVLMLTACSMDEQQIQGYESGADGYLAKPFNTSVLKAQCASLILNRKRLTNLLGPGSVSVVKTGKEEDDESGKSKDETDVKIPVSDIDSEFYNRFLKIFMAEMGDTELNVFVLARKMGLDRSQFYRKIKALTNFAPVELMKLLRVKEGRKLVLKTEKTMSEIAYAIGFSSPSYFSKCFNDVYGETPTELRNRISRSKKRSKRLSEFSE